MAIHGTSEVPKDGKSWGKPAGFTHEFYGDLNGEFHINKNGDVSNRLWYHGCDGDIMHDYHPTDCNCNIATLVIGFVPNISGLSELGFVG